MTANPTDQPSIGQVDTILHIGAGRCTELPDYLAANPARIVLIEPQPDRARALRNQAAGHDNVTVIEAAIAGSEAGDRLKVFNQSDYSSLRQPTGLREIFPGLRTRRELDVDLLKLDELIDSEALEAGQKHWLVIDAPGEEAAILDELTANEKLAAFARIDLNCGTTSLYESSEPAEALLQQLAENGYDVETSDAESDPDRPRWSLRRNPLRLENQTLRQQVAEIEQQTKELTASRDEWSREAEERKQAQEALQQEKESLEQKNGELEQQAKELEKSRDERAREAEERKQAQEVLQQEKESLEQKNGELEQRAKELEKSRDELAREAEERKQAQEALQEEKESLEKKVANLEKQLGDASTREQVLREQVTRAEGQIELVKDLVIDGPAL